MAAKPTTRAKVIELLTKHGSLTVAQMAEMLGMKKNTVGSAIRFSKRCKLLYICGWRHNYITRGRMSPKYALGNNADVIAPKRDRAAACKRYWRNKGRAKYGVVKPKDTFNPWTGLGNGKK